MQVTGHCLMQRIKELKDLRDLKTKEFTESVFQFPNENQGNPEDLGKEVEELEFQIAELQGALAHYNQANRLEGRGSVAEAIKHLGGLTRSAKLWKDAAELSPDPYSSRYTSSTKSKDQITKVRDIPAQTCMAKKQAMERAAQHLRVAIQQANAVPLEIDLSPNLFGE